VPRRCAGFGRGARVARRCADGAPPAWRRLARAARGGWPDPRCSTARGPHRACHVLWCGCCAAARASGEVRGCRATPRVAGHPPSGAWPAQLEEGGQTRGTRRRGGRTARAMSCGGSVAPLRVLRARCAGAAPLRGWPAAARVPRHSAGGGPPAKRRLARAARTPRCYPIRGRPGSRPRTASLAVNRGTLMPVAWSQRTNPFTCRLMASSRSFSS
jgi:hypothetical protein